MTEVVEQRLPHPSEVVDDDRSPLIDENERTVNPNVNDVVEIEPPRLGGGASSSIDSNEPVSSSGSRRKRKRKPKKGARRSPRRRHSRQSADEDDSVVTEFVCALEYVEGSSHRGRYIEVASPPCTAIEIRSLSALP